MKNYSAWTTEQLRKEEQELRMQGYDKVPHFSAEDRYDRPLALRSKMDKHIEWKAVCRELRSRQNRET